MDIFSWLIWLDPLFLGLLAPGLATALWARRAQRRVQHSFKSDRTQSGPTVSEFLESASASVAPPAQPLNAERVRLDLPRDILESRAPEAFALATFALARRLQHDDRPRLSALRDFVADGAGVGAIAWVVVLMSGWTFGIPSLLIVAALLLDANIAAQASFLPLGHIAAQGVRLMPATVGPRDDAWQARAHAALNASVWSDVARTLSIWS